MVTGVLPRVRTGWSLYFGLSLLFVLIVAVGFWPSYFGALTSGGVDRPAIIHFHAVIYVGWLMLFVAQTALAATGRLRQHMKLGNFLIGYGVVVIAAGLLAAFGMFWIRVRAGAVAEAQSALISPLLDMIVFTPFFAAAVYFRRVPDVHKRLMIVSTTALLIAAVGRMRFLGGDPWLVYVVWTSPILIAMVRDFVSRRLLHPIYVAGLIVIALESPLMRRLIRETDVWLGISGRLAGALAA
ncbi:hypothetical protein [Candidatus Rariloculus sp.]|uniref:hypothetical protein n=1 Tax=Candidatus Rariloculus sp. TaxID=3101265 RepID=UPI003D115507